MMTTFDSEKNLQAPVDGSPDGSGPGKRKWGIGAMVWFVLMILGQWVMFIEYATKPITAYDSAYQRATMIYGIAGAVGTAVYFWLIIGKKKAPLYLIVASGIFNACLSIASGGSLISALSCMIAPWITYAIAHNTVS